MAKVNIIHLRMTDELLEEVNRFRVKSYAPSISEAIRILIRKGVTNETQEKGIPSPRS